jgi:undecaprenyl-diphosphatase
MNGFDTSIIWFLNQFANRSCRFDWLVVHWSDSDLLKGAVVMFLAWWAAFQRGEQDGGRKPYGLLAGMLFSASLAVAAARILAIIVPFRERPLRVSAFHFQLPCGMDGGTLPGWSSFPSDHGVLFVSLAVSILFISRPLGWIALSYVAAFICLPRLYLGIHWPTDILAGTLIGVGFAYLAKLPAFSNAMGRWTDRWRREQPGLFFALLFFFSYQVTTMFRETRLLLPGLRHWLQR